MIDHPPPLARFRNQAGQHWLICKKGKNMIFETKSAAREYAVDQTALTRRKHKAVKASAWVFDRQTGGYSLLPRYTVILSA